MQSAEQIEHPTGIVCQQIFQRYVELRAVHIPDSHDAVFNTPGFPAEPEDEAAGNQTSSRRIVFSSPVFKAAVSVNVSGHETAELNERKR